MVDPSEKLRDFKRKIEEEYLKKTFLDSTLGNIFEPISIKDLEELSVYDTLNTDVFSNNSPIFPLTKNPGLALAEKEEEECIKKLILESKKKEYTDISDIQEAVNFLQDEEYIPNVIIGSKIKLQELSAEFNQEFTESKTQNFLQINGQASLTMKPVKHINLEEIIITSSHGNSYAIQTKDKFKTRVSFQKNPGTSDSSVQTSIVSNFSTTKACNVTFEIKK